MIKHKAFPSLILLGASSEHLLELVAAARDLQRQPAFVKLD